MTNEESPGLEQEHIAKEKAREKETAGEEKESPRNFTVKGLAEAFTDFKFFKGLPENMDLNIERFSLIEKNVHGTLSAYRKSIVIIRGDSSMHCYCSQRPSNGTRCGSDDPHPV